jgi:hypothetical protein
MHRFAGVASVLLMLAFLSACTPQNTPPPPSAAVKGRVKLNGKAMDGGEVRFTIPGQPPKILPIKDGSFSGNAFVGKNRVDIVLEKDGPVSSTDPKTPTKVNSVMHKDLEAEVTQGGPNEYNFEASEKK